MALFDEFPSLQSDFLVIRKMMESDVDALLEITGNENVYKYIPHFLYKKSKATLLTAIRNIGGRDFDGKKFIIAGIYLRENPDRLIGLAEMFDYHKRDNCMTIGYRVNETYWHRGIATDAVSLMKEYLLGTQGLSTLYAYVMPENTYSARALLTNGFRKLPERKEQKNWAGMSTAMTDVYACSNG